MIEPKIVKPPQSRSTSPAYKRSRLHAIAAICFSTSVPHSSSREHPQSAGSLSSCLFQYSDAFSSAHAFSLVFFGFFPGIFYTSINSKGPGVQNCGNRKIPHANTGVPGPHKRTRSDHRVPLPSNIGARSRLTFDSLETALRVKLRRYFPTHVTTGSLILRMLDHRL